MKSIAVFDLDGVVVDYEGALQSALDKQFGKLARCDRSLFSLEERYANNPVVLAYAQELTEDPNFYYPLSPIDGMTGFISAIGFGGTYQIVFVSSRPLCAQTMTSRWLRHLTNGLSLEKFNLFCGVANKAKFLTALPFADDISFVVDDNQDQLAGLRSAGFDAIAFDQPWNQNWFPRMYIRADGMAMLWGDASEEAKPFFDTIELHANIVKE